MIRAKILKPCVIRCEPGSVVLVSEFQFRCLGGLAKRLEDETPAEMERASAAETATAGGEPEPVETVEAAEVADNPETVENGVEIVENAPKEAEIVEKKSGRKRKGA